ncbi:uncharacterized protein LOC129769969 [Toxorhynchites rutilus septentrionalis]|uniref:uncharacterized protein LOC129769969 n=1 Tax=Toxorhynchites rutilus septentrionalis TaxID=329112 RepID=UPI0024795FC7|nr:uncharacterized protein LOC129769969 [Toxorhynchites rutilus septentrionalis]
MIYFFIYIPDTDKDEDKSRWGASETSGDEIFVRVLKLYGKVLLEKSQVPEVKRKKKTALKVVEEQLLIQYGISMSGKQISKKVQNLKARIKEKTDTKATGNKKITLKSHETDFFNIMGGIENPSVSKRCYGVSFGSTTSLAGPSISEDSTLYDVENMDETDPIPSTEEHLNDTLSTKIRTNVTQRAILEQQLKLIKAQQDYTAQLKVQQDERHKKEMELLALKKEVALL